MCMYVDIIIQARGFLIVLVVVTGIVVHWLTSYIPLDEIPRNVGIFLVRMYN